ncbi:STAS domain-containing protein [Nonomuraea zeae]|nr:STAS domain-containing protein [Nonomuraea zeae]
MMQLSVRLVPVGDTTLVIALTGELDSTTVPVLAAFLDPLPQSPVKYVVVAAGDLWFCDMNGLKQLSVTHHALLSKGGHLSVAEAQPPLRRLIGLMSAQIQPEIPVYDCMPEALAATDVEIYEAAAPPVPVRRHLPRVRNLHRAEPSNARRPSVRRAPPPPEPSPQLPILDRTRAMHQQLDRQRQLMGRQIDRLSATRLRLISARERCDDSLETMLTSLMTARSIVSRPVGGSTVSRTSWIRLSDSARTDPGPDRRT